MPDHNTGTIAVIGLGRLGLPMAAATAAQGIHVIGADIDRDKLTALLQGGCPVQETGLVRMLREAGPRLTLTTDTARAVKQADISFVFVPTPTAADGSFSPAHVIAACHDIGQALAEIDRYHLVVVRSTIMPGAMAGDVVPVLEAASGKRAGGDFGVCYSPEFLALGTAIHDYLHPDFVLIGESDDRAGETLAAFYAAVCENEPAVIRTSYANAELGKLAANLTLMIKATWANTMAQVCERVDGADVDVLTRILGSWRHIAPNFLRGATAYGGTCWPRDEKAILALVKHLGIPGHLPRAMAAANKYEALRLMRLALEAGNGAVGILGLSFKVGTPETAFGPAVRLAAAFTEHAQLFGPVRLVGYDPVAMSVEGIERMASAQAVVDAAGVVIVPLPDTRYRGLDWQPGQRVIDVWRVLDAGQVRACGAEYVPLGRGKDA